MKTISSSLSTLFAGEHAAVVAFVELQFVSGTHRYCTAGQTVRWNNQDWLGVGAIASIEPIKETESVQATGLKMSLSGVPTGLIAIALAEAVQGRPAKMWVAGITEAGAIVADPVLEFEGRVDTLFIEDGQSTCSIGINVESRMADFQRPNTRRFNAATHEADYPGDKFFSHVVAMVEAQIVWPAKSFF
ncbi:hypothetical protein [Thiohalocapsa marina]|uniref:hypothetical protein n=1 Tax=Thiohalocapsa marina TaxID=424902 RepID=UPI0036DA1290